MQLLVLSKVGTPLCERYSERERERARVSERVRETGRDSELRDRERQTGEEREKKGETETGGRPGVYRVRAFTRARKPGTKLKSRLVPIFLFLTISRVGLA